MNIWTILGKSISAILTGGFIGGLFLLSLSHFFSPTPPSTAQFSTFGILGGTTGGFIGLCWGWFCAKEFADEALSKLFELLLLGAAVLIIGGVTFLVKAF